MFAAELDGRMQVILGAGEVGNPHSKLSVGLSVLSGVKISGGSQFLYQNSEFHNSQSKLEKSGY